MASNKPVSSRLGALVHPGLHEQEVIKSPFTNATDGPACEDDFDELMSEDSYSLEALGADSPSNHVETHGSIQASLSGQREPGGAAQEGPSQTLPTQERVVVDLTLDPDETPSVLAEQADTLLPGDLPVSMTSTKRARHELGDDRYDDREEWRTLKKELYDTISNLRSTVREQERRIDDLEGAVRYQKVKRGDLQQTSERLRKERDQARLAGTAKQNDLAYANRQCKHLQGELERTKELLKTRTEELTVAQAFMTTADLYSVSDVCLAVEQLNEEIYQCAISLADTVLRYQEKAPTSEPSERSKEAQALLINAYGKDLVAQLQSNISEGDTALFESTVQSLLVGRCCAAFQTLCPEDENVDSALSSLREKILQSHEPAIARNWVAMTAGQFRDAQSNPASTCRFLEELMLAVGWRPEEASSTALGEKCEEIIQNALKIREVALEGVLSQEMEVFIFESDTPFAPDVMQDAFDLGRGRVGRAVEAVAERIICTTAMGVRCVKRSPPSNSPVPPRTTDVILKPKVLLASSLSDD